MSTEPSQTRPSLFVKEQSQQKSRLSIFHLQGRSESKSNIFKLGKNNKA